jgi:plasmid stabilization system protein ParE
MTQYHLSSIAEEDMLGIWQYVGGNNLMAADQLIDRFTATFNRIVRFPEAGTSYDLPSRAIRYVVVSPYLIFYEMGDDITILRVLHSARRWEALL